MPAIYVTFKSLAAHSQSPVLPINIRNNCEKNIYDQYTLLIISSTIPKGEDNENGKALLVSHARVCGRMFKHSSPTYPWALLKDTSVYERVSKYARASEQIACVQLVR